jgi:hypothetical protein
MSEAHTLHVYTIKSEFGAIEAFCPMKAALTFDNLREQIQRLGERHNVKMEDEVLNQAIALVTQYEVALLTREQNEKEMKKRLRLLEVVE